MPPAPNPNASPCAVFDRARHGVAIVLLVSAGSAALIAHQHHRIAAPAPTPPRQLIATPVATTAEVAPRVAPLAPVPTGRIAIVGDRIDIDIRAMPLGEAARQLAVATGTPLDGIEALRGASGQSTLKWQGPSASANAAWQQLLSADVNYVVRCVERACVVRVLGLIAASPLERSVPASAVAAASFTLPSTTAAAAASAVAPSPDPPGLFPSDG